MSRWGTSVTIGYIMGWYENIQRADQITNFQTDCHMNVMVGCMKGGTLAVW
jgi:hypothetical protein